MRIAVVGPTHPSKGGVAAHTTETAHHLAAAGHDVDLVSWSHLYPALLYPGEQTVPGGVPDVPVYDRVTTPLRWDRPWTWWHTGASLRGHDLVVVVVVVPAQVPPLATLVRALRRGPRPPRVVALVHNVVPHERHPGSTWLMERLLRAADAVLVHSAEQAALAREHGARAVLVADLPPHLPGGPPPPDVATTRPHPARPSPRDHATLNVLALGMVRDYKGVDVLLEAVRDVPGVHVTVAGEQWGDAGARVRALARDPALAGRVALLPGYVPGADVPGLLAAHDVLALTYRHATASQNVLLAHAHGLPVLASRVGTFGDQVRDGVDGLLVAPGDVGALRAALRRFADPAERERLAAGVPVADLETPWRTYVATLTGAAVRR